MSAKFDTLKFSEELESAGLARDLSRKFTVLLHDDALDSIATKHDLAMVEQRLENKLAALELNLTLRMGGMLIAAVGILIATQKLL